MANGASAASSNAQTPKPSRPPPEVVLPAPYYALLLVEVVALIVLSRLLPEESGGDRVSYALGWAGTGSMVLMHVYSLRRRIRAFRDLGRLAAWLHFHIFCGLQGAILVTYHSLHLHEARSIQGLNIFVVAVVVVSGMFGRYLYAYLPKSLSGERRSAREVETELEALASVGGLAPTPELAQAVAAYVGGAPKLDRRVGLMALVREDLRARRALETLEREFDSRRAQLLLAVQSERDDRERLDAFVVAARRRVLLIRRLATFDVAERLFRAWTLFHKPLTFILLGATLLHVLAHFIFAAGMSA